MRPSKNQPGVYLCREPVDFRKAINGLSVIVEETLCLDPFSVNAQHHNPHRAFAQAIRVSHLHCFISSSLPLESLCVRVCVVQLAFTNVLAAIARLLYAATVIAETFTVQANAPAYRVARNNVKPVPATNPALAVRGADYTLCVNNVIANGKEKK